MALPAEPVFWAMHVQTNCVPGEYLRGGAEMPSTLSSSHEAMCKAAMGGPFDPDYRRERSTFLSLLTGQALVEENRDEGKSAAAAEYPCVVVQGPVAVATETRMRFIVCPAWTNRRMQYEWPPKNLVPGAR